MNPIFPILMIIVAAFGMLSAWHSAGAILQ